MNLQELLEQNPEAKKEYELQIETLGQLGKTVIDEQNRYIDALEDAAMEGSKRDVLELIDNHYGLTLKGWEDGSLEYGVHWWQWALKHYCEE